MSQPANPGVPPQFQPPVSYGGYGGELQSYGQPVHSDTGYGASAAEAAPAPGYPPDRYAATPYPAGQQYPTNPQWMGPQPSAPYAGGPYGVSQAPPPRATTAPTTRTAQPPQRPGTIGLAATLASTASLQWIGLLSFCWLVASAGVAQLSTSGVDGGVYHVLSRFSYRMLDGLAWPLYLFPLVSFVLSFLLLTRRPWTRLAFSITGGAALLWSAWWLRSDLLWWLVPAGYIAITVLVLWTAETSRWYRWRPESDPAGHGR